jgi:uncharacterized membrane protein required for colicin V production
MTVQLIDVILLLFLAGFFFYGLFFGFIKTIGLFLGMIAGALVASRIYLFVFGIISPIFFGYDNLGKVAVFMAIYLIISKLTSFGFYFIEKGFNLLSIIPFLGTINRLAGAVLGIFTGALTIGLVLFVISRYAVLDFFIGYWLKDSFLAPIFLKISNMILPLLPEMLKKLNGLI